MRNVPQHIIDRARELPRHGRPEDLASQGLDDISKAYSALTNEANLATAGMGKFITMAETLPLKLKELAATTKFLEDRTAGLQKSFGLNIEKATLFYGNLATLSKEMGVGATQLAAYSANLQKLIGGYANLSKVSSMKPYMKDMLSAQTILQNQIGLSEDQAIKMQRYAALQRKSATDAIAEQEQIAEYMQNKLDYDVTAKDLMEDISGLSGDVLLQYGKMPGSLALAVTKAKLLGTSMEQLNKTGQNFLNIESSIGDELEYQLLSGRRLVNQQGQSLTNLYRQATIQGEAGKQADLMAQIVAQEGDTIRDNLFARQQLAKTLGVDEATLANMLSQQEMLKQLQEKGMDMVGASAEELDAAIKNTNDSEKKALLSRLKDTYDQRTTDQKMQDSLDVMAATMISAFGSPSALAVQAVKRSEALLKGTAETTNTGPENAEGLRGSLKSMGESVIGGKIVGEALSGISSFSKIFEGGPQKILENIVNATGTVSVTSDNVTIATAGIKTENDVAMGPGVGRVISGPEGTFSLNNKDSIIAGTDLFSGGGGGDMAAFAAAIVSAINNQTAELTRDNTYWT